MRFAESATFDIQLPTFRSGGNKMTQSTVNLCNQIHISTHTHTSGEKIDIYTHTHTHAPGEKYKRGRSNLLIVKA